MNTNMDVPLAPKKSKENLDETTYDDLVEVSRNLWAPRPKWRVEEGDKNPVKKEPSWRKIEHIKKNQKRDDRQERQK